MKTLSVSKKFVQARNLAVLIAVGCAVLLTPGCSGQKIPANAGWGNGAWKPTKAEEPAKIRKIAMERLENGDFAGASLAFSQYLYHDPSDCEARVSDAWCDLYLSRPVVALTGFDSVAKRSECGGVGVEFGRGVALLYLGHIDEAVAIFETELAKDPENVRIKAAFGAAAWFRGDYREAIRIYTANPEIFTQTEHHFSWASHAMNNLGWSYLRTGRYAEAAQVFERLAARHDSFSPEAFNGLAWACHHMVRLPEAEAILKKIRSKNPDSMEIRAATGTLAYLKGDYERAADILAECIDHLPARELWFSWSSHALHNLGWSLCKTGRLDEAAIAFGRLKKRHPAPIYFEAYNGLGWTYYAKGMLAEAEREFNESLKLVPENSQALSGLSLIEKSRREKS